MKDLPLNMVTTWSGKRSKRTNIFHERIAYWGYLCRLLILICMRGCCVDYVIMMMMFYHDNDVWNGLWFDKTRVTKRTMRLIIFILLLQLYRQYSVDIASMSVSFFIIRIERQVESFIKIITHNAYIYALACTTASTSIILKNDKHFFTVLCTITNTRNSNQLN